MNRIFIFSILFLVCSTVNAQEKVASLSFENIGPTVMSGRVVAIEVNPNASHMFYVAYATGGVWYTNNNGASFTSIMDNAPTQHVGSLAVDWKRNCIWIGTGEVNSSRSSYAGVGLLKSTNHGDTWEHLGLFDSHHISKIYINPLNKEEVTVAVIGHLYSKNKERGIYKTKDGGKTWENTLFINENTGVIDLISSVDDPNILYAVSWERHREAWHFEGNGFGSGIYKSMNGGGSWSKITTSESGFPNGEWVGRIGLASSAGGVLYAFLDNQERRKSTNKKSGQGITKEALKTMSKDDFLKLSDKEINTYLKKYNFQEKYRAVSIKDMVRKDKIQPKALVSYLEDANSLLFDTPVKGAELYRSIDGGVSWVKTHKEPLDDLVFSYGYYFGLVRANTKDPNQVYLGGVPLLHSSDGGKTFTSLQRENVHADHHELWINPKQPNHLINGNDGGVNISYDNGLTWIKCNTPTVGQFYTIAVDNEQPYNVYGGLQDNGVWKGPSNYKQSNSWRQEGDYPYQSIMGGDGMYVQVDPRDSNILYTGYQFGNYYRINLTTNKRKYLQPKHELGETPLRFNWQTPILLSSHQADILYFGANKLYRSMNKGDDFTAISDDLTRGGKKGNVAFGTITSISESPLKFGLLYTGSDDGLLYCSKNSGASWEGINTPENNDLWVTRVVASKYSVNRVYASLNGYRKDNFNPYLYVSEDNGSTWSPIHGNLPDSPINVIREDTSNEDILYIGNDQGVFVSFDRGQTWERMDSTFPKVAVHDLVIQEREKELLVATHGRSIYKTKISFLQNYNEIAEEKLAIEAIPNITFRSYWGNSWSKWMPAQTPNLALSVYSNSKTKYEYTIKKDAITLYKGEGILQEGFQHVFYGLEVEVPVAEKYKEKNKFSIHSARNGKYYLGKGTYTIIMKATDIRVEKEFTIE